jgi:hypothetical protein
MIEIILIAVIIAQEIFHYFERRDMYNRLMSKNLTEYKQGGTPPKMHIPSAHSRVLNKWRNKAGDE